MTVLAERPEVTHPEVAHLRSRNRLLRIAVVVLAMLLVVAGAWVIYELTAEPAPAVPDRIEQLVEDYLLAWESHDENALRAAVNDEFAFTEFVYELGSDGWFLENYLVEDANWIALIGFIWDWEVEQVGQPIITGEGPWVVSLAENWILTHSRNDGMASYVVVEEDGVLRIANHTWVGLHYDT